MLKSIIAGVAFGMFGFLGAAEASIVTVSYTGTFNGDTIDTTNYFNTGGLQGQGLTLTYVFDTNKGVHTTGGGIDDVSNLSSLGENSPALSVSMTAAGKTLSFAGTNFGQINASDAFGVSQLSQSASNDANSYNSASTTLTAPLGFLPSSITSPFSTNLGGLDEANRLGSFSFYNTDATTGYDVRGSFYASTLTISAVPLPSALPLFGLALVGLGTAAAFRKRLGQRTSR